MKLTKYQQAARDLDDMSAADPERAHQEADRLLLSIAPREVQEAYQRLVARSSWWACA